MSNKLVTIKVYESTRKRAKIAAAKAGVAMAQYIGWAVEELAVTDEARYKRLRNLVDSDHMESVSRGTVDSVATAQQGQSVVGETNEQEVKEDGQ